MIQDSPSEIYHHALAFSPSSSWLRESYNLELSKEVKVVKGLQTKWGACFRTVSPGSLTRSLACWRGLIAVGCHLVVAGHHHYNIIILDAITGMHMSVFSGHTSDVRALTFSSDGTFLISGSYDKTVNLWDIQTGGVIRTFYGHTGYVISVSISPDNAIIASGSDDLTIHLWDTWTGECHCIIKRHNYNVECVSFSPINSHLLMSASNDGTTWQWDIDGHQIGPTYEGTNAAFSPDGSHFILGGIHPTIRDSTSGVVTAELQGFTKWFRHCCLSPNGKFMAAVVDHTIYVWEITSSNPCLIETFIGHTSSIHGLTFSSTHSLVSLSDDCSIKFWQIGTSSTNPSITNPESTPLVLAPIESISLQANNGIAVSSDEAGVVRTWDISTGFCKASFHTPAKCYGERDAQFIGGKLVLVWFNDHKIHVWESEKGELPYKVGILSCCWNMDIRISGDGSKIFILNNKCIQAWSLWTGEIVGKVELEDEPFCFDFLVADGSRVWICLRDKQTQGWDFKIPGSTPIQLSNAFPNRPHLSLIQYYNKGLDRLYRIEDTVSGKEVFRLPERYAEPIWAPQWDGQYLVAGYSSGEVLILDLNNMIPQ